MKNYNNTHDIQMKAMILFYETAINHCLCGENKLESSIYQIDIPCIHRIALGAVFPPLPKINLIPTLDYSTLEIKEKITKAPKEKAIDPAQAKKTTQLVK